MITAPEAFYVGSYAGADQPGIYAFTFDATTGALAAQASVAGVANPSFIVLHPNGQWLYAVSETGQQPDGVPGAVWAFQVTRAPWSITPINRQPSGGDWPCHLTVDATGRWLLVANYATGSVGVLPIGPDGALGALADLQQHQGHGPHPERQTGPHAHSTIFAPDQRIVIAADLGMDALVVYEFDAQAGRLAARAQTPTRPGAGPRHMAFHPGGQYLYVANELDNTVGVYAYAAADSGLQAQQVVETLPPDAPENTVADIHITPAADRVYVSNRGHESVAVFDVAADGWLTRVAIRPCGGRWPRNFALAPGGRFLLVANQYSDALVILPVLAGGEALGPPLTQVALSGASCVQFVTATG